MRTDQMRPSENVEDRRGEGGMEGGGGFNLGGGRGGPRLAVGGIGGVIIVVLYLLLGGNPQALLQGGSGAAGPGSGQAPASVAAAQARDEQLVRRVLGDTEDVWNDLFVKMGKHYSDPPLVLFTGEVRSACGQANAAVGPFYCPGDGKVYIDLDFYQDLAQRFKAPAISRRRTSSPTKSAITCRTCSASPTRSRLRRPA